MARNAASSIENNFVGGVITQATGLNFPENAATNAINVVFNEKGNVTRREGVDGETGYQGIFVSPLQKAFTEYFWEAVDNNGNRTFMVQQAGSSIYIFSTGVNAAISTNLIGVVQLMPWALTSEDYFQQFPCQFASGIGRLFVTHPMMTPIYITYDATTNLFSSFAIEVQIRDVEGLPVFSPRTYELSNERWYNLLNQGWSNEKIYYTKDMIGLFPSDYDVWWLWMAPDPAFSGVPSFLPYVAAQGQLHNNVTRGNSPAPRGSLILSAFYQDRSSLTGLPGLPVVHSGGSRPSTVAFHAGRVFFAGINTEDFNNKIYFSQIIETIDQAGKCYQQNDPSAEHSSDFLPSDGGVISIPSIAKIEKLWSIGSSLIVFASNGVWEISGSQGIGFTATDYTVRKISSIGTLSPLSFVDILGLPSWWADDGIYIVQMDSSVGSAAVASLTDGKIDDLYMTINEECKRFVKGAYNPQEKTVQWLFRTSAPVDVTSSYTYNAILNLRVDTKAFYPFYFDINAADFKGIVCSDNFSNTMQQEFVTAGDGSVVTAGVGVPVFVDVVKRTASPNSFKYTLSYTSSSTYRNAWTYGNSIPGHKDWVSIGFGGVSFDSYVVTGYRLRGGGNKKWQNNYIDVFSDNRTQGRCYVQGQWDYANVPSTVRWTNPQIIQPSSSNYDYSKSRRKIRGHGIALQIRFTNYGDEPFNIIGWATYETGNANV